MCLQLTSVHLRLRQLLLLLMELLVERHCQRPAERHRRRQREREEVLKCAFWCRRVSGGLQVCLYLSSASSSSSCFLILCRPACSSLNLALSLWCSSCSLSLLLPCSFTACSSFCTSFNSPHTKACWEDSCRANAHPHHVAE